MESSSSSEAGSNDSTASTVTAWETSTWSAKSGALTSDGDKVTANSVSSSPIAGGLAGVPPPGSADSAAVMDVSAIVAADGATESRGLATDSNVSRLVNNDINPV
jgi:hypothetical protein